MILLLDKPNQLCNRIWSQAPLIALCLKENRKIIIPTFGKYASLFDNLNKAKNVHFINHKSTLSLMILRALYKCFKLIPQSLLALFNVFIGFKNSAKYPPALNFLKSSRKVHFVTGWNTRSFNKQLQANHQKLIEIYAPKSCSKIKVEQLFTAIRTNCKVIVGVHVRKGDYSQWQNGKYYFNNAVYSAYMHQIQTQLETKHQKPYFLISSNESVDLNEFPGLNVFQIPAADAIEDLYGLSLCDYIIGPPSTFSMWASFYGKRPLYFIKRKKQKIGLANFSVIVAQNIFENGKKAF